MRPDRSRPRHVLVVERDMIVGLGLAEDLAELGYRVSGPFISSRDVEETLAQERPDLAIVDVGLRDGSGPAAARRIADARIPLVLFSAGNRRRFLDGEFKGVPWVEKPAATERLLEALGERSGPVGEEVGA